MLEPCCGAFFPLLWLVGASHWLSASHASQHRGPHAAPLRAWSRADVTGGGFPVPCPGASPRASLPPALAGGSCPPGLGLLQGNSSVSRHRVLPRWPDTVPRGLHPAWLPAACGAGGPIPRTSAVIKSFLHPGAVAATEQLYIACRAAVASLRDASPAKSLRLLLFRGHCGGPLSPLPFPLSHGPGTQPWVRSSSSWTRGLRC